jgi:hypothetical protein
MGSRYRSFRISPYLSLRCSHCLAGARRAAERLVCSAAALPIVLKGRAELGPLGTRIEVRDLPPGAQL